MNDIASFDTETFLIGPGCLAPRLVCMSLAWPDGRVELVHASEARPWAEALLGGDDLIVGHNVAYDMGVLIANFPDLLGPILRAYDLDRVTDTKLREKLVHIALGVHRGFEDAEGKTQKVGYSLADITKRRLGIELDKSVNSWRLRYSELIDTPLAFWPKEASEYAIDDAKSTMAVYQDQEDGREYLDSEFAEARAAFALHLISCRGLRTDPTKVKKVVEAWAEERFLYEAICVKDGILKLGKNSGQLGAPKLSVSQTVVRKMVKEAYAGRIAPMTLPSNRFPKGQIQIDKDACLLSGDPKLETYAAYSKVNSRLNGVAKLLDKGTREPIQARFESLLNTGRTSSSPNVQNISRKGNVRECFIPRPGHVFVLCDYTTFELRAVAQVCMSWFGQSALAIALRGGLDPHLEIAGRVLGSPYEDVRGTYAEIERALETMNGSKVVLNDDQQLVVDARQVGKVANFGFPGGLGPEKLSLWARKSYDVRLSLDEAVELKRHWLSSWPEFEEYFKRIAWLCEQPKPSIRQLVSHRLRGDVTFTQACNTMFQGLAADAAKAALWEVTRRCWDMPTMSRLYGARVVNFVHDELILEVRPERAEAAAKALEETMVEVAQAWMPDVPIEAKAVVRECWSK